MVARINSGELDAGFFVSHLPSEVLKTVANDDRNILLSVDPRSAAGLLSAALSLTRIPEETYGAQRPGEPPIDTLSTRAVLVAKENLSANLVERITKALFSAQDFLGIEGGEDTMAMELRSLALHPGARAYYEGRFIPYPGGVTWSEIVGFMWRALAILVILAGGYQGILKLRRDRISNGLGREILAVPIDRGEESVRKLIEIRDGELLRRVRLRWWKGDELDRSRWRNLHDLINDRIKEAKENAAFAS
jgi:hypothetical protein